MSGEVVNGVRAKGYNRVVVKDGDTIAVFASMPLSITDPAGEFPVVAQAYRVVCDWTGPTLVLVPLSEVPVRVSAAEAEREKVIA